MTYTIWKIVLKLADIQDIEVPEGAELLTAREQNEQPCVWFKCDPSKPTINRCIRLCATGDSASQHARYIGTCFLQKGQLVFHVFESPLTTIGL